MCDVLVTGTFNILHAGHIQLLEYASTYGRVTVGVNADSYLHKKYGIEKTVPLLSRVYVLRACRFVSEVVVFTDDDPSLLISKLRPSYFVRGPDYLGRELPEQPALNAHGVKLIIHCADKIHNSSSLVDVAPEGAFSPIAGVDDWMVF